jgi:hypothetical protein
MRVQQTKAERGSQKWIQELINVSPFLLDQSIQQRAASLCGREICWCSPLEKDDYAEYRDADFLKRIGLGELSEKLNQFWPPRGPQWDALGVTFDGKAFILVEAKANVPELVSFCGAKDDKSLKKIHESLTETQRWLDCSELRIDWKSAFYQYANRLAHLYFLREKAHKEAYLIFLYFVADPTHIPTSQEAWDSALNFQKKSMGLSGAKLNGRVIDLFINTRDIQSLPITDHRSLTTGN